jgi:hypothetical protein
MWALRTTLMAMRSSSQQDRDQGYGLPPTEFTDLPRQKGIAGIFLGANPATGELPLQVTLATPSVHKCDFVTRPHESNRGPRAARCVRTAEDAGFPTA